MYINLLLLDSVINSIAVCSMGMVMCESLLLRMAFWWQFVLSWHVLTSAKPSAGVFTVQVFFSPDLEEVGALLPIPLYNMLSVGFSEGPITLCIIMRWLTL